MVIVVLGGTARASLANRHGARALFLPRSGAEIEARFGGGGAVFPAGSVALSAQRQRCPPSTSSTEHYSVYSVLREERSPLSVETFLPLDESMALGEGLSGKWAGPFPIRAGTALLQQGSPSLLEVTFLLSEGTFAEFYPSALPFYPQGHRLEGTFAKMTPRPSKLKG